MRGRTIRGIQKDPSPIFASVSGDAKDFPVSAFFDKGNNTVFMAHANDEQRAYSPISGEELEALSIGEVAIGPKDFRSFKAIGRCDSCDCKMYTTPTMASFLEEAGEKTISCTACGNEMTIQTADDDDDDKSDDGDNDADLDDGVGDKSDDDDDDAMTDDDDDDSEDDDDSSEDDDDDSDDTTMDDDDDDKSDDSDSDKSDEKEDAEIAALMEEIAAELEAEEADDDKSDNDDKKSDDDSDDDKSDNDDKKSDDDSDDDKSDDTKSEDDDKSPKDEDKEKDGGKDKEESQLSDTVIAQPLHTLVDAASGAIQVLFLNNDTALLNHASEEQTTNIGRFRRDKASPESAKLYDRRDVFGKAVRLHIEKGGLTSETASDDLQQLGFEPIVVNFSLSQAANKLVQAKVEAASAEAEEKASEHLKDVQNNFAKLLALATVGMDKGVISGKSFYRDLAATFASFGVKGADSVARNVCEQHLKPFLSAAITKAGELAGKDPSYVEGMVEAIQKASYSTSAEQEEEAPASDHEAARFELASLDNVTKPNTSGAISSDRIRNALKRIRRAG